MLSVPWQWRVLFVYQTVIKHDTRYTAIRCDAWSQRGTTIAIALSVKREEMVPKPKEARVDDRVRECPLFPTRQGEKKVLQCENGRNTTMMMMMCDVREHARGF